MLLDSQRDAKLYFATLVLVFAQTIKTVLTIVCHILEPFESVQTIDVLVQLIDNPAQRSFHYYFLDLFWVEI